MKILGVEKNFDKEVLSNKGLTVVDFWAHWCGPCKRFSSIFEKVAKNTNNIKFCKLNVDNDFDNICKKYGVMSIPTIILFNEGKEIKKNIGFLDEDELKNFLTLL